MNQINGPNSIRANSAGKGPKSPYTKREAPAQLVGDKTSADDPYRNEKLAFSRHKIFEDDTINVPTQNSRNFENAQVGRTVQNQTSLGRSSSGGLSKPPQPISPQQNQMIQELQVKMSQIQLDDEINDRPAAKADHKLSFGVMNQGSNPPVKHTGLAESKKKLPWALRTRSLDGQKKIHKYPSFEPPVYILPNETITEYLARIKKMKEAGELEDISDAMLLKNIENAGGKYFMGTGLKNPKIRPLNEREAREMVQMGELGESRGIQQGGQDWPGTRVEREVDSANQGIPLESQPQKIPFGIGNSMSQRGGAGALPNQLTRSQSQGQIQTNQHEYFVNSFNGEQLEQSQPNFKRNFQPPPRPSFSNKQSANALPVTSPRKPNPLMSRFTETNQWADDKNLNENTDASAGLNNPSPSNQPPQSPSGPAYLRFAAQNSQNPSFSDPATLKSGPVLNPLAKKINEMRDQQNLRESLEKERYTSPNFPNGVVVQGSQWKNNNDWDPLRTSHTEFSSPKRNMIFREDDQETDAETRLYGSQLGQSTASSAYPPPKNQPQHNQRNSDQHTPFSRAHHTNLSKKVPNFFDFRQPRAKSEGRRLDLEFAPIAPTHHQMTVHQNLQGQDTQGPIRINSQNQSGERLQPGMISGPEFVVESAQVGSPRNVLSPSQPSGGRVSPPPLQPLEYQAAGLQKVQSQMGNPDLQAEVQKLRNFEQEFWKLKKLEPEFLRLKSAEPELVGELKVKTKEVENLRAALGELDRNLKSTQQENAHIKSTRPQTIQPTVSPAELAKLKLLEKRAHDLENELMSLRPVQVEVQKLKALEPDYLRLKKLEPQLARLNMAEAELQRLRPLEVEVRNLRNLQNEVNRLKPLEHEVVHLRQQLASRPVSVQAQPKESDQVILAKLRLAENELARIRADHSSNPAKIKELESEITRLRSQNSPQVPPALLKELHDLRQLVPELQRLKSIENDFSRLKQLEPEFVRLKNLEPQLHQTNAHLADAEREIQRLRSQPQTLVTVESTNSQANSSPKLQAFASQVDLAQDSIKEELRALNSVSAVILERLGEGPEWQQVSEIQKHLGERIHQLEEKLKVVNQEEMIQERVKLEQSLEALKSQREVLVKDIETIKEEKGVRMEDSRPRVRSHVQIQVNTHLPKTDKMTQTDPTEILSEQTELKLKSLSAQVEELGQEKRKLEQEVDTTYRTRDTPTRELVKSPAIFFEPRPLRIKPESVYKKIDFLGDRPSNSKEIGSLAKTVEKLPAGEEERNPVQKTEPAGGEQNQQYSFHPSQEQMSDFAKYISSVDQPSSSGIPRQQSPNLNSENLEQQQREETNPFQDWRENQTEAAGSPMRPVGRRIQGSINPVLAKKSKMLEEQRAQKEAKSPTPQPARAQSAPRQHPVSTLNDLEPIKPAPQPFNQDLSFIPPSQLAKPDVQGNSVSRYNDQNCAEARAEAHPNNLQSVHRGPEGELRHGETQQAGKLNEPKARTEANEAVTPRILTSPNNTPRSNFGQELKRCSQSSSNPAGIEIQFGNFYAQANREGVKLEHNPYDNEEVQQEVDQQGVNTDWNKVEPQPYANGFQPAYTGQNQVVQQQPVSQLQVGHQNQNHTSSPQFQFSRGQFGVKSPPTQVSSKPALFQTPLVQQPLQPGQNLQSRTAPLSPAQTPKEELTPERDSEIQRLKSEMHRLQGQLEEVEEREKLEKQARTDEEEIARLRELLRRIVEQIKEEQDRSSAKNITPVRNAKDYGQNSHPVKSPEDFVMTQPRALKGIARPDQQESYHHDQKFTTQKMMKQRSEAELDELEYDRKVNEESHYDYSQRGHDNSFDTESGHRHGSQSRVSYSSSLELDGLSLEELKEILRRLKREKDELARKFRKLVAISKQEKDVLLSRLGLVAELSNEFHRALWTSIAGEN